MHLTDPATLTPALRVAKNSFNGAAVWEKHALVERRPIRTALHSLISRVSGLNVLRSSYISDARAALKFEAGRMSEIRDSNFRAPVVLKRDPEWSWIVMTDMGQALTQVLKSPDLSVQDKRGLLTISIETLGDLHTHGQYHGWANLRNITLDKRGIGFIDLEHNPLSVMSLPEAQARDAVLMLIDASRHEAQDPGVMAHLVSRYIEHAPANASAALAQTCLALTPATNTLATIFSGALRAASVVNAVNAVSPRLRPAVRGAAHTIAPPA